MKVMTIPITKSTLSYAVVTNVPRRRSAHVGQYIFILAFFLRARIKPESGHITYVQSTYECN